MQMTKTFSTCDPRSLFYQFLCSSRILEYVVLNSWSKLVLFMQTMQTPTLKIFILLLLVLLLILLVLVFTASLRSTKSVQICHFWKSLQELS